jgi:hypothetical protein
MALLVIIDSMNGSDTEPDVYDVDNVEDATLTLTKDLLRTSTEEYAVEVLFKWLRAPWQREGGFTVTIPENNGRIITSYSYLP